MVRFDSPAIVEKAKVAMKKRRAVWLARRLG